MCPIRSTSSLFICFLLALTFSLAPFGTAIAEDPWDQEVVLAIAENLEASVKDLRTVAREARNQGQRRQERIVKLASQELKQLQGATRQLVSRLKAGEGRDETLSFIKRINQHRNETALLARKAAVSVSTQAKLSAANGLVKELEFYYYTTDVPSEPEEGGDK